MKRASYAEDMHFRLKGMWQCVTRASTLSCSSTVIVTPWDAMQASRLTKTKRFLQAELLL